MTSEPDAGSGRTAPGGIGPETLSLTRRLARAAETVHGICYYAPEINRFVDDGFRGWWHAYFAYRLAPLGPVNRATATAVFYNFAPRMVGRAVPGVWDILTPEQVLARRDELVRQALVRMLDRASFGPSANRASLTDAAQLASDAVADLPVAGRPLAAAHAALPPPPLTGTAELDAAMQLWRAATIWREYRGDSHNVALAAADVDGPSSHLLMVAKGRGNRAVIGKIRGWTDREWDTAAAGLEARGILEPSGRFTEAGVGFRDEIETATDRLSVAPVAALGRDRAERLAVLMRALADALTANGEVAGVWPPPSVGGAVEG